MTAEISFSFFLDKYVRVVMRIDDKVIFYHGTIYSINADDVFLMQDNQKTVMLRRSDISQVIER